MKWVVLTDVHANLPALDAALAEIQREGYDHLYHTGDVLGTCPFPAECLDRLLHLPRAKFVMGNHDAWFAFGLNSEITARMTEADIAHQHWQHARIDPALRAVVASWPYAIEETLDGVPLSFVHYGLRDTGRQFVPLNLKAGVVELDEMFAAQRGSHVFYGHAHHQSDVQGRARYITPGALGCHHKPTARYAVVVTERGSCRVEFREAPYDDAPLIEVFERSQMPQRELVCRNYLGGRFAVR